MLKTHTHTHTHTHTQTNVHNTASELHNDSLGTYFDENYKLSDA